MGEDKAIQHDFVLISRENVKLCPHHHGELSDYEAFLS